MGIAAGGHSNVTDDGSSGRNSELERGFCARIEIFFGLEPFSGTLTMRTVLVKPEPERHPVTTTTRLLALTIYSQTHPGYSRTTHRHLTLT